MERVPLGRSAPADDIPAGDSSPLPFLRAAIRRHLEEFPSISSGLSRTEQQALETIGSGVHLLRDVFVKSHHEREEAIFLGDTSFLRTIETLGRDREPLVRIDPDGEFLNRNVDLTSTGLDVLAGRRDRVRINGIDRWLGGVHLQASDVWRWDGCQLTR